MTDAEMRALTRQRRAETRAQRLQIATLRFSGVSAEFVYPDQGRAWVVISRGGRSSSRRYRGWKEREWRDGRRHCTYCGVKMNLNQGHPHSFTVDHREPLGLGGDDDPGNWVGACWTCNNRKGSMTENEFRALLAA